jgi:hypothetical protein
MAAQLAWGLMVPTSQPVPSHRNANEREFAMSPLLPLLPNSANGNPASIALIPSGTSDQAQTAQVVIRTPENALSSYRSSAGGPYPTWTSAFANPILNAAWSAPAIALDPTDNKPKIAVVTQNNEVSLYNNDGNAIGTLGALKHIYPTTSVVGLVPFQDGQWLVLTIGINGGLYWYFGPDAENAIGAQIPGGATVLGASMTLRALSSTSTEIHVVAFAAREVLYFWSTYKVGQTTPLVWNYNSINVDVVASQVSIAVRRTGEVDIVTLEMVDGYNHNWGYYWVPSPGSAWTLLGLEPGFNNEGDGLPIAVDDNGVAHVIRTYATIKNNFVPQKTLVVDNTLALGASSFGFNNVLPASLGLRNPGMPAMIARPNGEIDLVYSTGAGPGTLLYCTLPLGGTTWTSSVIA